ncbi:LuxR C-terminal-related transcriptional regulator [Streptomyces sp. NPDC017991]|uniref:response regulator transcription factor n=1 Tax=Streptomyces sp. NPDC017991 TaxID=3365026 RepID=UPI00379D3C60
MPLAVQQTPSRVVPVTVHATSAIDLADVTGRLRMHPSLHVEADAAVNSDAVAVLVHQDMDAVLLRLRSLTPGHTRAVLITGESQDVALLHAINRGVGAILWRHELTTRRLHRAVHTVSRGGQDLPRGLLSHLVAQVVEPRGQTAGRVASPARMSTRETDILRLVADGMDNSEIAERLGCPEFTVRTVLYDMAARLHLRSRAHAVAYALRGGHI